MPATFATATHTGLVRHGNEDALLAQPPVFAVADGMGGALAGEVAAGMAVEALAAYAPGTGERQAELDALLLTTNEKILAHAASDVGRSGMGTTLTAAVLGENAVDIIHVGDSRAYRLRGGVLEQLTQDHSLVGEMVRRGELSEEEALVHPQRSIITRALGADSAVRGDYLHIELEPGDLFLLCSDGLYSMVDGDAITAILNGNSDLEEAAAALVEAANGAGGADNVTVVLISPDGSRPEGAPAGEAATADAGADPAPETAGPEYAEAVAVRPRRWWRSWKTLAATGAIVLALLSAGIWYMTQQIYYLGESDGRVAIYQGLPLELGPLTLSSLYRQSDVLLEDLEPFEQERVRQQELSSLETAELVLDNYTGELRDRYEEEQRSRTTTSPTTGRVNDAT